jgi:diaminobutyrate-2-oxoglutarate transaminase
MALVLMKPEHDKWKPGEHNGTFRGLNLAFATATATLERYWRDDSLTKEIDEKAKLLNDRLEGMAKRHPEIAVEVRGRGLIQGIECKPGIASQLSKACFERGLIIETAGANDQVLKFLPALVIEKTELEKGLSILEEAFDAVAKTATTHASSESLRA